MRKGNFLPVAIILMVLVCSSCKNTNSHNNTSGVSNCLKEKLATKSSKSIAPSGNTAKSRSNHDDEVTG